MEIIVKDSWVKGTWEHITNKPIKIESKEHLKKVCEEHNCAPKILLKPKSQGQGYEVNWK